MATTIFDITPEELKSSAQKLSQQVENFTKAYGKVYSGVEDLRVRYKGEASDTFNQRIESYRDSFTKAENALKNYVAFLQEYAEKIIATENEIKGRADALGTIKV